MLNIKEIFSSSLDIIQFFIILTFCLFIYVDCHLKLESLTQQWGRCGLALSNLKVKNTFLRSFPSKADTDQNVEIKKSHIVILTGDTWYPSIEKRDNQSEFCFCQSVCQWLISKWQTESPACGIKVYLVKCLRFYTQSILKYVLAKVLKIIRFKFCIFLRFSERIFKMILCLLWVPTVSKSYKNYL